MNSSLGDFLNEEDQLQLLEQQKNIVLVGIGFALSSCTVLKLCEVVAERLEELRYSYIPHRIRTILNWTSVQYTTSFLALTALVINISTMNQEDLQSLSLQNNEYVNNSTIEKRSSKDYIMTFISFIFFLKTIAYFAANNFKLDIISTAINMWMMAQMTAGLCCGQYVYAFEFLVLQRCRTDYYCAAIVKFLNQVFGTPEELGRSLVKAAKVVILLNILAGFFQTVEEWSTVNHKHIHFDGTVVEFKTQQLYYYFVVSSLTTIGYGDVTPTTMIGRVIISSMLLFGIPIYIFIVRHIGQFYSTFQNYLYMHQLSVFDDIEFAARIVIVGKLQMNLLDIFLEQFLKDNCCLDVIVLREEAIHIKFISIIQKYGRIKYVQGIPEDPLALRNLFKNRKIIDQDALLILADPQSSNSQKEDHFVEKMVSISKLVFPELRILGLVHSLKIKRQILTEVYWSQSDHIICLDEWASKLMVQNSKAPGSAAMLINLFTAVPMHKRDVVMSKKSFLSNTFLYGQKFSSLQNEYEKIKQFEIFVSDQSFDFKTYFAFAASYFYQQDVILIGYQMTINNKEEMIIYPTEVPKGANGVFIANDKDQVQRLQYDIFSHEEDFYTYRRGEEINDFDRIFEIYDKKQSVALIIEDQHSVDPYNDPWTKELSAIPKLQKITQDQSTFVRNSEALKEFSHFLFQGQNSTENNQFSDIKLIRLFHGLNFSPESEPPPYTIKLNSEKNFKLINELTQIHRERLDPLSFGNVISTNLILPIFRFAYYLPKVYDSILSQLSVESGYDLFSAIKLLDQQNDLLVDECFKILLRMDFLLVGIYRRVEEEFSQRIILTNPHLSSLLTSDDILLVIKKTKVITV